MQEILCSFQTPLQLTNCIEYLSTKDSFNAKALIVARGPQSRFLIAALKQRYSEIFSEIVEIEEGFSASSMLDRIFVHRHLKRSIDHFIDEREFDEVVLGHTGSYHAAYLAKVCRAKTVIVDDGVLTLKFLKNRKFRERFIGLRNDGFVQNIILRLVYGVGRGYLKKSLYFSCYADYCGKNELQTSMNDYSFLKRRLVERDLVNEVHFVGQPLYPQYISFDDYLALIKSSPGFEKLVYIPHPAERDVDVMKIKSEVGCALFRPKVGYEEFLTCGDRLPKGIVSINSSSLPVIHYVFGSLINYSVVSVDKYSNLLANSVYLDFSEKVMNAKIVYYSRN